MFRTLIGLKGGEHDPILNWEGVFFLAVGCLLLFQEVFLAVNHVGSASDPWALRTYAAFTATMLDVNRFSAYPILGLYLLAMLNDTRSGPARHLCDVMGAYYAMRMAVLLLGLNILISDASSSRYLLITQLLFFLPYMLLIWGWIYWRLDAPARLTNRELFHVDCDCEIPRPLDYLVASFSSVFSASISAIKGRSARARILILVHGIFVYDVMALTLSRAVALVQSR